MEWREVRRQKERTRGVTRGRYEGKNGRGALWGRGIGWRLGETFFFRNFPEECKIEVLWDKFGRVGRVEDVFVPTKRDKTGNKFGFVRFSDVMDTEERLERLNNVWIETYVIRAYVPRFGGIKESSGESGKKKYISSTGVNKGKPPSSIRAEGKTFAEALSGKENKSSAQQIEGERRKHDSGVLNYQSTEEENKWIADAFTGHIKDEFSWEEHGEEICSECAGSLKILNMGNNLILIQSESDRSTAEVLGGFDEWGEFWTDWRRPWKPFDVNQKRKVWTRWTGVPMHAWNLRFFCHASGIFGGLVRMHEGTRKKGQLERAYILVSTGFETVDRILRCDIDGVSFPVRVEEVDSFVGDINKVQIEEANSESEIMESDWEDRTVDESVLAAVKHPSVSGSGGGRIC